MTRRRRASPPRRTTRGTRRRSAISPLASASGLPCSLVMSSGESSCCSSMRSDQRRRIVARSFAVSAAPRGQRRGRRPRAPAASRRRPYAAPRPPSRRSTGSRRRRSRRSPRRPTRPPTYPCCRTSSGAIAVTASSLLRRPRRGCGPWPSARSRRRGGARTARISARIDSAVSAGVSAPMSSPAGPAMRSMRSSGTPASSRRSRRRCWFAGAQRADVERVRLEGALEGRHVELVVVREHDHGRLVVGSHARERLLRPGDDQLVRAGDAFGRGELAARVREDRAPADCPGGGAERLSGVDGAVDEQPRRRAVHLGEDPRPAVEVEQGVAAAPQHLVHAFAQPARALADGLAALEDEQLAAEPVPSTTVKRTARSWRSMTDLSRSSSAASGSSTNTSISPPQGSPTAKASSSEIP